MTSLGINENVEAALSYVLGIISGAVVLLFEKESTFARFHAMQSIMLSLGYIIARVLVTISIAPFMLIPGGTGIGIAIAIDEIVLLIFAIAWIACIVKALMGEWFKLPVIGDFAEKALNSVNV